MKINTGDDVACSINGFGPELSWSLVFIEHRPGHLNECSVLAFHDFCCGVYGAKNSCVMPNVSR